MLLLAVLLTVILWPLAAVAVSSDVALTLPFPSIEVRFESITADEAGSIEQCEVVQLVSTRPGSLASWGAFGEVRPHKERRFELVSTGSHCGIGVFAASAGRATDAAVPYLVLDLAAGLRLDPAPMDPGPVPAAQLVLALTSRRLEVFGPDGKPQYVTAKTDRRVTRVTEGEEVIIPVILTDGPKPSILGAREVLIRIRARQSVSADVTEYGAVEVVAAPVGAEIFLDGGAVGRAGVDGSLLISNVAVGEREVRASDTAGGVESRMAIVVRGRTVAVSFDASAMQPSPGAVFVRAGKNSQGFSEFRRVRDNAVMVRIPEGEFMMGNLDTEGKPLPHSVFVSTFLIDKLPVTQGRFRRFAAATGRVLPPAPYWGARDDHPVVFVRWEEARAYCEWTGARLPTEAEREKAARGTDDRKFPWGNEEPSPERAVFRRNWGYVATDPVGTHPSGASPYGILDVGGNVWEWCEDWFDSSYYQSSPRRDPMGPRTGQSRVVRGGSWDSRPSVLSSSARNFAYIGYREGDFGFRCAADPPR